ncbi:MAG: hypothetical protein ACLSVD_13145 [Eggerthellaceae bacterium]
MTDFQRIVLVHYHEIGLKGHNRASFEMRLLKNLEALLEGFPVVTIHRIAGRLCVFLKEGTGWETAKSAADVIGRVPGVARVVRVQMPRDLDSWPMPPAAMTRRASSLVQGCRPAHRFATGSMDMNQIIGASCSAFPTRPCA